MTLCLLPRPGRDSLSITFHLPNLLLASPPLPTAQSSPGKQKPAAERGPGSYFKHPIFRPIYNLPQGKEVKVRLRMEIGKDDWEENDKEPQTQNKHLITNGLQESQQGKRCAQLCVKRRMSSGEEINFEQMLSPVVTITFFVLIKENQE